jgi:hypothetical protein
MHTPDTLSAPGYHARAAGNRFVDTKLFEIVARAGFIARGLVYLIIGILALDLATGNGGKITNQQGAMRTVEHQPFGHVLLALLAVGLGGYALWRLVRGALGHGPDGADKGIQRVGAIGSGIVYAGLCAIAVSLLTSSGSSGSSSSGNTKQTASGVFSWPAGRWLVLVAGVVIIGVGVYQLIRGVTRKFLDDDKTERMGRVTETWITWAGVVGHVARAVVFGLVGVFLVKAAIDYKANEAIGLDGALAKLYSQSYGPWLLGAVAAGLVAFGVFSITEARYRRI